MPTHLEIFHTNFPTTVDVSLAEVLGFLRSCAPAVLELISQVTLLVKLMLVMPATNATSERAFSSVRRIKTYLRSTMSQQRLNHLMLLHVHKSSTDQLSLVDVANDFIAGNEHRQHVFGRKFSPSDLLLWTVLFLPEFLPPICLVVHAVWVNKIDTTAFPLKNLITWK